ncbi:MAG: hypothetical protein GC180_02315 [Bacteroidetes bacterium]|nr:hypothetical protein [Bacteroidota bacterium]
MARKKGATVAKAPVQKKSIPTNKSVEQLYSQLVTLMKKNKVSKRESAEKLGMSYQGFLNSFNHRNLKLDAWYDLSELVNKPFVARFESAKTAAAIEAGEQEVQTSASAAHVQSDDFTALRLKNAEEKISILEKQIAALESQIQDKQTIIELIRK